MRNFVGADFDTLGAHVLDFIEQRPLVQNNAIADHRDLTRPGDSRWQQAEFVDRTVDNQSMSGIVTTLKNGQRCPLVRIANRRFFPCPRHPIEGPTTTTFAIPFAPLFLVGDGLGTAVPENVRTGEAPGFLPHVHDRVQAVYCYPPLGPPAPAVCHHQRLGRNV